ncbi:MAG: methyltransferase domain-containing protein [Lachnospiraceae bacterium]|nr:methyltransferase domain-containing protein [Lachnospiraceae bacterium]
MDSYQAFAGVYDELMADVPYDDWCERIDRDIRRYGVTRTNENREKPASEVEEVLASERDLVADLACGTGIVTRKLFDKGYDVFGIDISSEMLTRAYESDEGRGIMYLNQDICELDLYSTIGTAICVCDSLNYLLSDEELQSAFDGVSNFLYPGGIFIFDCNTSFKYRESIGESTIAEAGEDVSFIWDNYYDEEENVNECDLTLFIKREDGLYERAEETHLQRGIEKEDIENLALRSGLEIVLISDSDTGSEVNPETERLYAVLRKPADEDLK